MSASKHTSATSGSPGRRYGTVIGLALALALSTIAVGTGPAQAGEGTDAGFVQWEDATSLGDSGYRTASTTATASESMSSAAISGSTNAADFVGSTNAADFWQNGITGAGVDIALIDTGVAPVAALTYPGKVINGPDLSFGSQADNLRYLDGNGHGTHLAGIIAGRSNDAATISADDPSTFLGMAPGARILNVKVGDAYGAVDISQVIAAIDWVIAHRNDNGMNVRVIALGYGTDGVQPYQIDPLAHAVEMAWRAGIVVVVAAGNDGSAAPLRNPASDPFVIAVGASENAGAAGSASDDTVPLFSNCGTAQRFVDLVAPGKSIISLRNPGSVADVNYPQARVGDDFFLGSGTSQAAAVVAGAVALLLEQRPELTPDQTKRILTDTAQPLPNADSRCQGAGNLDLAAAFDARTPKGKSARQSHGYSDGSGFLDAARGSYDLYDDGVVLEGEIDIMGNPWFGYNCPTTTTCQSLWDGGNFNGAGWSGASWSGASWSGASWSGASWSGASWSGASWSSKTWSGASWSGASWSGASWSGASWSGASWSGASWSDQGWE